MKNIDMLVDLPGSMTERVAAASSERAFRDDMRQATKAFYMAKWGNVPQERENANNKALESLKGNILARYNTCKGDIVITTDFQTVKTMFKDEH